MGYKSDIEIAQETVMEPITAIAEKAGIDPKYLEPVSYTHLFLGFPACGSSAGNAFDLYWSFYPPFHDS